MPARGPARRDVVGGPTGAPTWSEGLSEPGVQVADLLRQGRTAKEVGRELGLSPTTVVTYKNRIFKKSNVASLKEFLIKAPAGCVARSNA